MKKLIRQPLIHFLLIGAGFFALFQLTGATADDARTIVVDQNALMTYFQYRSKAFNQQVFEAKMAAMSPEEFQQLIDEYVRQEVLFREAMAMGLDKEDFIIKQRMIQKVEFISEGIAEAMTELSDEEVERYYEENKGRYYLQPFSTFTHVFFDFEKWGENAQEKAQEELSFLNGNSIPFSGSLGRGDRFYYHTNYVERDPEYVNSHFGPVMAKAIFESEASDETWIGPFPSEYGYHLVMVTTNEPGRYPELAELRERVEGDARRDFVEKQNEATIQRIIDQYDVRVVLENRTEEEEKAKDEEAKEEKDQVKAKDKEGT